MIRLSANLSKKVPMPDVEFSSQQYGASMEIEVSDVSNVQEIADRLQNIYGLLEQSIDQQIAQANAAPAPRHPAPSEPVPGTSPAGGNGNGSRRGNGHASPAQIKALFAISKDKGMSRNDLVALLEAEYSVERPDDLTVRNASDLIGRLQRMEGAPA